MKIEKNNISNNVNLFFASIQYYYTADIPYYALEILALILCFLNEEVSQSILPFTLKWTRLLLYPTVGLPVLSPFFHRFSKFKAKTIVLSPPLYPFPNQFSCILTIMAIQVRYIYPILAIVFFIIGFTFPILTKWNSFLQIIISCLIGAFISFSYDLSPQIFTISSLLLTYFTIFIGFFINKPFSEEIPISFQSHLIDYLGKTIFDTFLHLITLSYGKRCLIGFIIQFSLSYISKLIENYSIVINKRTFL